MPQDDDVKIELTISAADAARLHRAARELDWPWSKVLRAALGFYLDAVDRERE